MISSRPKAFAKCILSLILFSGSIASAQKAPAGGTAARKPAQASVPALIDRESFYLEMRNELDKSLKGTVHNRVEKNVKLDNLLAASQDPWSLTWTNKGTETMYEYNAANDAPPLRDLTSTLTLKYENQKGFSAQVYGDYYDNRELGEAQVTRYSRSNYGVTLSQDLVAIFKKSAFTLNAELTELQGKSKMISGEETYLNEILKVVDSSFTLYSSLCKRQDLEKVYAMAKETLKTGEAQHAARTISTRDFLRIKGTFLGIQRQVESTNYEIHTNQEEFLPISESARDKAIALSSAKLKCEDDVSQVKGGSYPSKQEIDEMVKKYPSVLSLELSKEQIKKKFETFRTNRDVKVNLSAGFNKTNNEYRGQPRYDQSYVGITVTYQFQGDLYNTYKQSVAEQFQDVSIQQKQTISNVDQYLNQLYSQIEFQMSQVPLIQDSIVNATRLLKIIETQQSIGQLDASSIDSAYQAEIQAQGEKRTLLASISSVSLKLSEIKKAIEKSSTYK